MQWSGWSRPGGAMRHQNKPFRGSHATDTRGRSVHPPIAASNGSGSSGHNGSSETRNLLDRTRLWQAHSTHLDYSPIALMIPSPTVIEYSSALSA